MKPINLPFAEVLAFLKTVDKKIWIIVSASAVGLLLVIIFLVIPAWIERPMLRRDIQGMESQIRQINELNEKQKGWDESRKVFGALIESTQARVFTAGDMDMLLGQVSKMASESRVDVLTSKPLTEKAVFPSPYNIKYQPSGYEFSVQGGYHDLANLVSRIEGHEKLLRIHRLEIVPAEKTPERHIAELTLWAIIKAPPQPVAPAKKAAKAKNVKK